MRNPAVNGTQGLVQSYDCRGARTQRAVSYISAMQSSFLSTDKAKDYRLDKVKCHFFSISGKN